MGVIYHLEEVLEKLGLKGELLMLGQGQPW